MSPSTTPRCGPRLRHPDRLVVESRQHSLSDLRRVQEEIERTLEQRATQTGRRILTSIGEGKGVIRVALRADQENLASELAARYGSAVELRVGGFSFPDRLRSHPQPPAGPAMEEQTFEGLEMSIEVNQKVLEAGDDGHGRSSCATAAQKGSVRSAPASRWSAPS